MAGDSIDVQLGEMVLQERVAKLEAQNEKLRAFLDHYKTVERAAGAISVQYGMSPDDPFDLLRGMAQTQRCGLHGFAKQVLVNRGCFPRPLSPA